ncbi:MAG: hypothetical protein KDA73_06865 [Rhodobacteraceae bacterium]|nr:hypothetical protein [Paracoccaceae bacterium]
MAEGGRPGLFVARQSYRRRRLVDAVRLLPVFAVVLVLMPLLWGAGSAAPGLSERAIYLFVLWLVLVAAAGLLSRALQATDAVAKPDPDADSPGADL